VQGLPLPWCPHCGGALSAPVATAPWTTRWVAHVPPGADATTGAPAPLGPTPRYHATPRWGLPSRPWVHPLTQAEGAAVPSDTVRARALAASARPLLVGAAVAFVAAAGAEAWRYGLLLRGRTELLGARTVALSDSLVVAAGVLAPVLAVVSALVVALWLVRARRAAAEQAGLRDSRSARAVLLGALLPVVNLGQAGVLVTELERSLGGAGPSRLVRRWWAVFVLSGLLAALTWGWRLLGTAQAQADAVVLAGLSDLAAAVTAVLTLVVVLRCTERLGGAARPPGRRWVASVPAEAREPA
jgi:hypothetical protein